MITKSQAETERYFHDDECRTWRRNGATQLWKTRPADFRVPVKYGLYAYGQIWHTDAHLFHVPGDPKHRCGENNGTR